jgi:selenide,water dikinase
MFTTADYPNLLVGLETSDDAAVYRIGDDLAIVQTLDYITPIVDDPYTYGAIAAANALSDVYAMGGEVVLALNIACFPSQLPPQTASDILRGGAAKVREAGAVVAGGHTVDDPEPKYGLSVMGTVHPRHIATKAGARPGDVLVLTKPLGVGIITTAAKGDEAKAEHVKAAVDSMLRLNRIGSRLVPKFDLAAMTDITGFALLGHAQEMAEHSGVQLRIHAAKVPLLPGAMEYANRWLFPGGSKRNRDYFEQWIAVASGVPEELLMLMYTPETSGGLLIAVPADRLDSVEAYMREQGQSHWVVGDVRSGRGIAID